MMWFFSALAGLATGVLSGFGIGGGTLLILWLTLVAGMDQFHAGGVNLVYFIFCALPAVYSHAKHKLVDMTAAKWCGLAGIPACVLGAILASLLDVTLLRRIFGVFLLVIGFRELFSKRKEKAP